MCKWMHLLIINTLRPRQNGRHFPNDIFKCIFLNENVQISIRISLKFSVVWWVIGGVMVGLSQLAPAVGWGSTLHAWLASMNWIGCARYLNRGYRYGVRGMHYHILLRPYSKNYYTYKSVVKNTYSPCHKDACGQIPIANTEWLLRYKGVS